MTTNFKKAVVLLSGGMDSATTLAIAIRDGFEACTMSFNYGQRHSCELDAAQKIADTFGVERRLLVTIDLRLFGGSALTSNIEVPKNRSEGEIAQGIPITYVPARNTIFLAYALGWAEVIGAHDIFIGVNAVDYSGYPDCRPEFIRAFESMANLATKEGVEGRRITIRTPLIHFSKAEIIKTGVGLGVDYSLTFSCYDPSGEGFACGECDSCQLRKKGFRNAGIQDPTRYR
ncbi:MAG: 7-cyano-7-deazaguanine synthase QueC [Candidatus Latescibacter sp.]|nr:7-cyano-7-deazaguanine synthase QueC [Candidatus Latescibacter sp.]